MSQRSTEFVEHPLIKPSKVEGRKYQLNLALKGVTKNILIVIPTGLGKTAVALLIMAEHLRLYPEKKCLFLAPTRVLVHQHHAFLLERLNVNEDGIVAITGEDGPGVRREKWEKRVICATPQVAKGDLLQSRMKPKDFSLIIFDEAHRAVGNHPYCSIGLDFTKETSGRIIGLTASPPSDKGRMNEVLRSLSIHEVELRDERSEDVKGYVYKTRIEWVKLSLPPVFVSIRKALMDALSSRLKALREAGLTKISEGRVRMKALLELRKAAERSGRPEVRAPLFSAIRLVHAIHLLEAQGLSFFVRFIDKLRMSRGLGARDLLEDALVKEAYEIAVGALATGMEHPKLHSLEEILTSSKGRTLIFASYRDSVEGIYKRLASKGFRVGLLIGKGGEGGQSQAEQMKALEGLKRGEVDALVATQVGEEGLDVADCDTVVFYDNAPSAVRFVQRRGRTGRRAPGKVFVFMTKGTRDEAFYWVSRRKLKESKEIVRGTLKERMGPLDRFLAEKEGFRGPIIYVDHREAISLVERLRRLGAYVEMKSIEIGDFVASSEVIIERKTVGDFVKSVIDGRLFRQTEAMKEAYARPMLIVQGDWREAVGIGESAFFGALASIVSDFQTPIIACRDEEEVAKVIYHIARREQTEKKREARVREGRKPPSVGELQRYIVSGLPGVSTIFADRLLRNFKTVEKVFTASEAELKRVKGVGEKMAKRVRKLSSTEYEVGVA